MPKYVALSVVCLFAFTFKTDYRSVENTSFGAGETLEYRVHYGLLNAAEATVAVSPQLQNINGRPCYKVEIKGRTVGAFDWATKIRDRWQSWIDTSAIVPQKSYRNIQEDTYTKEETVTYDHAKNDATVHDENGQKTFNIPNNAQDIISGYYFLRTINFDKSNIGDIVQVPTFFDKAIYQMKIRYGGKSVIKTKFGKLNVIKLNPVMPDNKLFKGDNSVRIWVSDDINRVPVKVEVDLWVGSMVMEVKKYNGLKQEFKWL